MKKYIKSAGGKRAKKASALLVLLFAGNVAKGLAEEKIGTIVSEPDKRINPISLSVYYTYMVDSTGNSFSNRELIVDKDNMNKPNIVFDTLTKYLVPGQKFVFETNGKNEFREIYMDELLALIAPDGRVVELTELFSRADIKRYLTELDKKLKLEGR